MWFLRSFLSDNRFCYSAFLVGFLAAGFFAAGFLAAGLLSFGFTSSALGAGAGFSFTTGSAATGAGAGLGSTLTEQVLSIYDRQQPMRPTIQIETLTTQ